MARSARTARSALAAGVAVGALALGACAPITTQMGYAPSDGTRVDFEDTQVRGLNLLVIATEEGGDGNLLGALANNSDEDVEFTLTASGAAPVTVPVPAEETVYLGTDGEETLLGPVDTIPGGTLEATLEVAGQSETFYLPVFDGTLPEYADYLP
ncbi:MULTISPECIES: hypothetical protein [unclassified Isoptericola]|uniref:hypothetical protein n=1 Tax=unclassified Isoptericola TaxID=2623355 RepID=UPI0027135C78|nr:MULTISPECIES: hypothetical protein [unclassified Isoptericola]MDO8143887.1 hypothetical protein [Isoptericola sp. 178]MDO8149311.1 hypothetical protein [Isoptericola sp. b515]MDO8152250.1 hypothetical protein [Isoptericola sp. b408]